jgi:hypothetical protein
VKGWRNVTERQLKEHLAGAGDGAAKVVERKPARRKDGAAQAYATEKRRRAHPEHDQQVLLINKVRKLAERYKALALFHSIPNGGFRTKRTAALMKAEGALSGIPDTHLPIARWWPDGSVSHGLYIEMKAKGGRLSAEQKEVIPMLEDAGYKVAVCYSADEALQVIAEYLEIDLED